MSVDTLLTCYNKGCGKQFNVSENSDGMSVFVLKIKSKYLNEIFFIESCTYHPGTPVFHDALKGWSCCNKKSTDFSTFLSYPGCTKGQHSNVKPKEPEKVKEESTKDKVEEIVTRQPLRQQDPIERPSDDEELIDLQVSVSPSLVNTLGNPKMANSVTFGKQNFDISKIYAQ